MFVQKPGWCGARWIVLCVAAFALAAGGLMVYVSVDFFATLFSPPLVERIQTLQSSRGLEFAIFLEWGTGSERANTVSCQVREDGVLIARFPTIGFSTGTTVPRFRLWENADGSVVAIAPRSRPEVLWALYDMRSGRRWYWYGGRHRRDLIESVQAANPDMEFVFYGQVPYDM